MNKTTQIRPIDHSIPIALLRARESVMAHFRPLLAARGYTEQQWRVLRILNEFGVLETTQLAGHSVLLMPSLTRILKHLEDKGVISRTKDNHDARRFLIKLSPKGQRLISDEAVNTEKVYDHIEERFGPENTKQLMQLLSQLASIDASDEKQRP